MEEGIFISFESILIVVVIVFLAWLFVTIAIMNSKLNRVMRDLYIHDKNCDYYEKRFMHKSDIKEIEKDIYNKIKQINESLNRHKGKEQK